MLADTLLVFDNVAQTIKVVSHALRRCGDRPATRAYDAACARIDAAGRAAARGRSHAADGRPVDGPPAIALELRPERLRGDRASAPRSTSVAGDVIQVVLAQRFECALRAAPVQRLPLPAHR